LEGKTAFQLVGGHPAVDLVNTLDWRFGTRDPQELLRSYGDLLRFTEQSGILTPHQARQLRRLGEANLEMRALQRAVQLREALAEILYAYIDGRTPARSSIEKLERCIHAARLRQQLHWKQGNVEWEWGGNDAALPVWALALSASDLLFAGALHRVRACGNPDCRWLFLDTSKNHTRQWCDMKLCGNRMKARRFKAQRKASPLDPLSHA
jgi:predicted RNA-binding Zn ribbon-like protein